MVFSRYARIPRTVPLKCAIGSPHIPIAVFGTFTVKGVKYKKGNINKRHVQSVFPIPSAIST